MSELARGGGSLFRETPMQANPLMLAFQSSSALEGVAPLESDSLKRF